MKIKVILDPGTGAKLEITHYANGDVRIKQGMLYTIVPAGLYDAFMAAMVRP